MDGEIDDDTSFRGSVGPGPDHDSDDDVASWPSIYSYHGSSYPHWERFMDEDGVTVVGSLHRPSHAQYTPLSKKLLQQDPDGIFKGASLSILNGALSIMMISPLNAATSWKGNMS